MYILYVHLHGGLIDRTWQVPPIAGMHVDRGSKQLSQYAHGSPAPDNRATPTADPSVNKTCESMFERC